MRLFLIVVLVAAAAAWSCENGGKLVDGKCRCKKGYGGKMCEIKVRCCMIYGDPHFLTYDGARVNFQGSCSYQASGVCPCVVLGETVKDLPKFSVMVDTWRKGKVGAKVSWTKSLTVTVNNHKILLNQHAEVSVNEVRVMLPYKTVPGVTVDYMGDYVRVDTEFGASASFDGNTGAMICVPEKWHGKTCGICGNNNGDKLDDYVTRDGTDVSSMGKERNVLIGNSWRDVSKNASDCQIEVHDIVALPSQKWVDLAKNQQHCGAIVDREGPFAKCITKLGNDKIMSFFDGCKFDVYESQPDYTEAREMACAALSALATECKEIGAAADKMWRQHASCPLPCGTNFVYSSDAPACPATCADPNAPEKCTEPNTQTCVCKPGFLLENGVCVKPGRCGCVDEQGSYHKVATKWYNEACSIRYRCKLLAGNPRPTVVREPGCKENETCKPIDGNVVCVKKPVPGGWSDFGEWSECQEFGGEEGTVHVRVRNCNKPEPKYGGECVGRAYETQQCL